MTLAKDLQAIRKKLAKLSWQTEKLAAAFKQAEKPMTKSTKTETEAKKVTKKASAKSRKNTDTDKNLAIINKFKKGVDAATLMKKTGFNQKKVRNILHRTSKQAKIIRAEKGIYVGIK
jgi:hypothetical protein